LHPRDEHLASDEVTAGLTVLEYDNHLKKDGTQLAMA
jgi:hypothetical protein